VLNCSKRYGRSEQSSSLVWRFCKTTDTACMAAPLVLLCWDGWRCGSSGSECLQRMTLQERRRLPQRFRMITFNQTRIDFSSARPMNRVQKERFLPYEKNGRLSGHLGMPPDRGVQLSSASALLKTGLMTRSSKSAHHSDSCTDCRLPFTAVLHACRVIHWDMRDEHSRTAIK
jgi:hypothetical protein